MKLSELATLLEGRLVGNGDIEILGVSSLAEAAAGDLSFLANARYAAEVAETRASAVLVGRDWQGTCPCALVRVDHPDRAFAEAAARMAPPSVQYAPGVHPSAVVAEDVQLGAGVSVGPLCVIQAGAKVGARTVLVASCTVGQEAVVGEDCRLHAHVSVRERCELGARVIVHDGSVIGSDGFGYTPDAQGQWHKVMQIGKVEIGDDVEIGANVTIDRARFGSTRIGRGAKIDNLVQVAHNVQVGEYVVMAAQVGISGSTRIGRRVQLGGQAGLAGHLQVGEAAIVGAQAGVTKSVEAGSFVSGYPAMDHRKATRMHAHLMRLPELKARVRELERALAALKKEVKT